MLRKANFSASNLKARLENVVDDKILKHINLRAKNKEDFTRDRIRNNHLRKLEILRNHSNRFLPSRSKGDWVLNLSSKTLSDAEHSVLSRGLNFSPSPSTVPVPEILASVEPGLEKIDKDKAEGVRCLIAGVLYRSVPPKSNLSAPEKQALKSLKTNKDIVIIGADKGRTTVVMNRNDYIDKVTSLLTDRAVYTTLPADPTSATQRKLNTMLRDLLTQGKLGPRLYDRIRCTSGRIPLFYGLPKIHKENIPLRPIVSFCGSPTYQLSRHLATILSPLTGQTGCTVSTSQEFVRFIQNVRIDTTDKMVSFDVKSLFTCIPKSLAVSAALERLRSDTNLPQRTQLSPEDICNLLDFCLDETVFAFNGVVYKQLQGTAMGSPVSSVVANLCMESFEQTMLNNNSFHIKVWKRYVDDTFVVLPACEIEDFHLYLNTVHPNIQFTREDERDGLLPFLDVLVNRSSDGGLSTSVYRKPTHTDRYLDFGSHHPTSHKMSVVKTLYHRAQSHCSSELSKADEITRVRQALRMNNYPSRFASKNYPLPLGSAAMTRMSEPKAKATVTLPYVERTSEAIARILGQVGIKAYYKPCSNLRDKLVHVKDQVPQGSVSGVVYRIPCKGCEKMYIGETIRPVSTRIKEHARAVKNQDPNSQLAEHALRHQHEPDLENFDVLHRNVTNRGSRLFLESWESHKNKGQTLNRFVRFPEAYHCLLNIKGAAHKQDKNLAQGTSP